MTIDEYILQHIDDEGDYLKALYRDTHVKLLYPRMASGHLQGRMLKMFVRMIRPRQVLEIGTYSGYSALCIAEGLPEGGMLHTFEINDEQEDFTRPVAGRIPITRIKSGSTSVMLWSWYRNWTSLSTLPLLTEISVNTLEYYEMVLARLSGGGYIHCRQYLVGWPCAGRTTPSHRPSKQSVSKPSMIWWRGMRVWRKSFFPCVTD